MALISLVTFAVFTVLIGEAQGINLFQGSQMGCEWTLNRVGRGTGAKINIGRKTAYQCGHQCREKARTNKKINGASRRKSDGMCWCEQNMKGKTASKTVNACFLAPNWDCQWSRNKSPQGATTKRSMGKMKTAYDCSKACKKLRSKSKSVNGATMRESDGMCWCLVKMAGKNAKKGTNTCFLKEPKSDAGYSGVMLASAPPEKETVPPTMYHIDPVHRTMVLATAPSIRETVPPTMKHVDPVHQMSFPYSNYKDKTCPAKKVIPIGCYTFKRSALLVYWRYDIEWHADRMPSFGRSFLCACADAAKAKGYSYFGTHFWGECWGYKQGDSVKFHAKGDCMKADGKYKNYCTGAGGHGGGQEKYACLGYKHYYMYAVQ